MYTQNYYDTIKYAACSSWGGSTIPSITIKTNSGSAMPLQEANLYYYSAIAGIPGRQTLLYTGQTATTQLTTVYLGFGLGTAAESIDDYKLENLITSGLTLTTIAGNQNVTTGSFEATNRYTLSNTTSNSITINEWGIFGMVPGNAVLLYREVLTTPITIPANDSVIINVIISRTFEVAPTT